MSAPTRRPTHRIQSPSITSLHAIYPGGGGGNAPGPSGVSQFQSQQHGRNNSLSSYQPAPPSPLTPSSSYNRLFPDRGSGNWANGALPHKEFEETQNKTFCKWLNTRLEPLGYAPLSDLGRDFQDGTRLIQLVEILTDEPLGRYNKAPVMRVQKAENVIKALDKIKQMGVHLTNIGPEDVMDGNRKLILGMIWLLVLRFLIADINEEGSHAKEGLLLWCQRRTQNYAEVDIQNFSRSWQDGLAFCALIHRHRPDLLDYDSLSKNLSDAPTNTELAFEVAAKHLGIPRLLDVEDVCYARRPDEKSIMTYVAQFFHAFSNKAKEETEARVIVNFVEHMKSIMIGIHDYERRVRELIEAIVTLVRQWQSRPPMPPYAALKSDQSDFSVHKASRKRSWLKEKSDVVALLGNVQTKLRTYGLKGYTPPDGLSLEDLDETWQELLKAEANRSRAINASIRQIKEELRVRFATLANEFEERLQMLAQRLSATAGALENQVADITRLQNEAESLRGRLPAIRAAEHECFECNVDENDHTIYSYDDLAFELDQFASNVTAKRLFIENQIVARSMTNVTPEQLEEFESAFRAFDKDQSNTLKRDELFGALNSLGISDEIDVDGQEEITFEAFIRYLVDRNEERLSAAKIRSTFRALAGDKGYVTDLDLKRVRLPEVATSFLRRHMPKSGPQTGGEDTLYDYEQFLDELFE